MNKKQLAQLPHIFRGPFLRKVAVGNYYSELSERLETAGLSDLLNLRLADVFEKVYEILLKHYRCEYVFKTALLNLFFDSELSANHQSFVTDEFRVGNCRVDLAIFSAFSMAFEIKTEFDSAARLKSQAREYSKVFDFVSVVTTEKMLTKLNGAIPKNVGVLTLDDTGNFTMVRDSESHAEKADLNAMFDCLRQDERTAIVEAVSGQKMHVPLAQLYTECKRQFRTLIPFEAHARFLEELRHRGYPARSPEFMLSVPNSLKFAALMLRASQREVIQLKEQLEMKPRNRKQKTTAKQDNQPKAPHCW